MLDKICKTVIGLNKTVLTINWHYYSLYLHSNGQVSCSKYWKNNGFKQSYFALIYLYHTVGLCTVFFAMKLILWRICFGNGICLDIYRKPRTKHDNKTLQNHQNGCYLCSQWFLFVRTKTNKGREIIPRNVSYWFLGM